MSTLEYLDGKGTVTNFTLVPWRVLHSWLSHLNGNLHADARLPDGVNRGKVLEELEARRMGQDSMLLGGALKIVGRDRGYGMDWRDFENDQGTTHLEELFIYQPKDWRKQAREYFFRFQYDLGRNSQNQDVRVVWKQLGKTSVPIFMATPILIVLFHPEMKSTSRYEPLNFLLAYGVPDPLPSLMKDMNEEQQSDLMKEVSPLDYFLEFQNFVSGYRLDLLRKIGKENSFPRLRLIKELDFSDIIGQRLAKQFIRQALVTHVWNRSNKAEICSNRQPLSMIFAGPSGNGKTELALWLSKLMNKPGNDFFVKVDCGKLSDASEVFGMAGAYQGSEEGSALNNFVLRMSLEPDAIGIVLLDEIEKAARGVIHGLYQVIDKGEWTNKRLTSGRGTQTEIIQCYNLVFIMTTNACDQDINSFCFSHEDIYTIAGEDFQELGEELATQIRNRLRTKYPFTDAFIGRVGRIIPFLPMADGDPDKQHALLGEMMTVAKLLIERQQEKYSDSDTAEVRQLVSASTKHRMAKIVVKEAIRDAGVRSIQKAVEAKMGDRMMHALLLEKGGIQPKSQVQYFAKEEEKRIDFRLKEGGDASTSDDEEDGKSVVEVEDEDLYG